MNPIITFLQGGKKVSDIEYLAIKEFGGKLRSEKGSRSTTGDLVRLVAASGKDMYMARAKVNFRVLSVSGNHDATVELQSGADGSETTREIFEGGGNSESGGTVFGNPQYEFVWQGKVAATEVIQLEVTVKSGSTVTVEGVLEVFEETTGDSPAV